MEKLIASHGPAFLAQADAPARQDIYVAACRIVLRLVFTLFAEARDLLPRGNPIYWHSYSLAGLLEQLLRTGAGSGRERLRHRFSAWPRLIALGRLVHAGSPHEALPLLPYGGELFAPGDTASADGISRALAVFESACFDPNHQIMSDHDVLEVLTLITRTQTVIRQGRGRTTVTVPVDFSDLSSEYIGILYEGLLDYELRCVTEDEAAVLFLAIGHEPARDAQRAAAQLHEALGRLGATIFVAREIEIATSQPWFVPAGALNSLRRDAVAALEAARASGRHRLPRAQPVEPPVPFPEDTLSYLANVYNHRARDFYARHGVRVIDAAYESHQVLDDASLMITKHCVRWSLSLCPKQAKGVTGVQGTVRAEPLVLRHGDDTLTLRFDCKPCEMHVVGRMRKNVLRDAAAQPLTFYRRR